MNILYEIKRLTASDAALFRRLVLLFNEVFETGSTEAPDEVYFESLLAKKDFVVLAAVQGNEVIGGLMAYELQGYYSQGSELFIYDIAVLPAYQRIGIGKSLLLEVKEYCRKKDIALVFVAADEEDAHAIEFYKSAGGEAQKVVHFNYSI